MGPTQTSTDGLRPPIEDDKNRQEGIDLDSTQASGSDLKGTASSENHLKGIELDSTQASSSGGHETVLPME